MLLLIFGIALGLICLASAAGDLRKDPKVTESLYSIGVKESQLPVLAGLKVLGAAGLLVGVWLPWLGILTAVCLFLYFLLAVVAHVRVGHKIAQFGPALGLTVMAFVVAYFEFRR